MIRTITSTFTGFLLLLAFFGLLAPSNPAQSKKDRQRAEKLINEGARLLNQKNFQGAVNSYVQALGILPNDANAHFQKGRAHFFLNEYDLAVTEFNLAQQNGHKAIDVYSNRWRAYEKLQKYDEALADIKNVLTAEPNNSDYLAASAEMNFNKGNYQEASGAYERLIIASPRSANVADLYYRLALSKSKLGDIEGQAAAAEEAIKRNTLNLADALMLVANARFAQKRVPEAIDAYSRALASRPDKVDAYLQLAELYRGEDRIDEGIEILKKGKNLYPTNGDLYTSLSLFYSLAGKPDEAVEAGKAATQLLPDKSAGFTNLCRAYAGVNKPELAIGACNSALRLTPDDGETLFYLARAQEGAKNPKEAEKTYNRAVDQLTAQTKAKPDSADAFYMLGNAYSELGSAANATAAYKRSIELNPRYSRAFFNLALIYINGRNKSAALEQYNALLQLNEKLAASLKPDIDKLPAN